MRLPAEEEETPRSEGESVVQQHAELPVEKKRKTISKFERILVYIKSEIVYFFIRSALTVFASYMHMHVSVLVMYVYMQFIRCMCTYKLMQCTRMFYEIYAFVYAIYVFDCAMYVYILCHPRE